MSIRVGHLSTFYHTAILLLAENRVEDTIGTGVDWNLYGTGPAIISAFENNDLDLAYIGLPPAIIGIDRGIPIKCIAGGHMEGTVLIGQKGYRGLAELGTLKHVMAQFKGKAIGVPAKGSIHDVIVAECLERFHLNDAVRVINFPWADMIVDEMKTGRVSAAAGTPALAVALQRFIGGSTLCPPSSLWADNPSYGIIADSSFLERERDAVSRFIELHEEASRFLRDEPRNAARIIADYVGIVDSGFVYDTLTVSPKYCAALGTAYISATIGFVKTLKRLGYIHREVTESEIFDTSIIRGLHPGQDHYG